MVYHHIQTILSLTYTYEIIISLRVNLKQEKISAGQDLNLHPSQSGQVPLPLNHLHCMLSLLFNS